MPQDFAIQLDVTTPDRTPLGQSPRIDMTNHDGTALLETLSRYLTFKPAGRTWKALCPFHPDTRPSFVVFTATQRWHCFGCCLGGDAADFEREWRARFVL